MLLAWGREWSGRQVAGQWRRPSFATLSGPGGSHIAGIVPLRTVFRAATATACRCGRQPWPTALLDACGSGASLCSGEGPPRPRRDLAVDVGHPCNICCKTDLALLLVCTNVGVMGL